MASEATPASCLRPSFPCTGADLASARACELRVFGQHFGNSAEELEAEFGPYEGTTSFGAVFLDDGTAVGAVRLLRNGQRGLKSLNDAATGPWGLPRQRTVADANLDEASTWDVGSFGVDSLNPAASHQVTLGLFAVLFGAFRDNGVTSFIAILDHLARRPISMLGVQMLDLPGATPAAYLGSASSVPVFRHVRDLHALHLSRFSDVHQQVFHGRGIHGLDPSACRPGAFALAAT
jgi:hypothetical protein